MRKTIPINWKKLLVYTLIVFSCTSLNAQSITFTESISSNDPNFNASLNPAEIYSCAWSYNFVIDVDVNACPVAGESFTVTIPGISHFDLPNLSFTNLANPSIAGNSISFQFLNSNPAQVVLPFNLLCNLPSNTTSNLNTYSYSGTACTLSSQVLQYTVFNPVLTKSDFSYWELDGTTPAGTWNGTVQLLYKKNDDHHFIREWEINLTSGRLRHLAIDFLNVEYELEYINFEFASCANTAITIPPMPPNSTIELNPSDITALFPSGYMDAGDCIRVREIFRIDSCTVNTEDTEYNLRSVCTDYGNSTCDVLGFNGSIEVNSSTRLMGGKLLIAPNLQVCDPTPSDIIFRFHNPAIHPSNTMNSGIKKLDTVIFSIDLEAFSFDPVNDLDSVYLRWNGIDVSIADIQTAIGSTGFFTYSPIAREVTLNFNELNGLANSNPLLTDWGGDFPFLNWYDFDANSTTGNYNDMRESDNIYIVFKDMHVDFDVAMGRQYPNSAVTYPLSDCQAANRTLFLFGDRYYNGFASYFDMCDVEAGIDRDIFIELLDLWGYASSTNVTSWTEASDPDVLYGVPTFIDFNYSYPCNTNPWVYGFSGNSGNSTFFNDCHRDSLSYYAEIVIPTTLDIGDTIRYFTDANDLTSYQDIPTPIADANLSDTFANVYVIPIEEPCMPHTQVARRVQVEVNVAGDCVPTTFGFSNVEMRLRSVCDDACPDIYRTISCMSTEVFWRCNGPCCGPPQGTGTFNFDRITTGWADQADYLAGIALDSLNPMLQKQNRVYTCDSIYAYSEGSVGAVTDSCGPGWYTPQMDSLWYEITYTSPLGNFQFFDLTEANFIITPDGGGTTYTIGANPTITVVSGEVLMHFGVPVDLVVLQSTGAEIDFEAKFVVNDNIPSNTGFFIIPQIRGQFWSIHSNGNITEQSCDDFGDNMLVLNVRTLHAIHIYGDGWANQSMGFSGRGPQCTNIFSISSVVSGGITGFDEFPNEFRPVVVWPQPSDPDQISMEFMPGYHLSSASFRVRDETSWYTVDHVSNTNTTTLLGYDTSNFVAWPILDRDGSFTTLDIVGQIFNDCPPEEPDEDIVSFQFPYIDRAYASFDADCAGETILYDTITIPNSNYLLELTTNTTLFSLDSDAGCFPALDLEFSGGGSHIDNFWIYNLSNGISIDSIIMYDASNGNSHAAIMNSAGYWVFPNIVERSATQYTVEVCYQLSGNCSTNQNLDFQFEYGFSCTGGPGTYPPPNMQGNDFACGVDTFGIAVDLADSNLEMQVDADSLITNPCDTICWDITLSSVSAGDAEDLLVTINNLDNALDFVSAVAIYNGNFFPLTPISFNPLVFDIDAEVLNGNGLPSGEVVDINCCFVGDCSLWGDVLSYGIEASANDICGNAIAPINGSPYNGTLNFLLYQGGNPSCNGDFCCASGELMTNVNNCTVQASVLGLAGNDCVSSIYYWTFGDGNSLTTSSPNVAHTYGSSGTYSIDVVASCITSGGDTIQCSYTDVVLVQCQIIVDNSSCIALDDSVIDDGLEGSGRDIIYNTLKGYSLTGKMHHQENDLDHYLLITDDAGNQTFHQVFGDYSDATAKEELGNALTENDDYIYTAGYAEIIGQTKDIIVTKIRKSTGTVAWKRRYDFGKDDVATGIFQSKSNSLYAGQIFVTGYTNSKEEEYDMFALKLEDANGSPIGHRFYGNPTTDEFCYDAVELQNAKGIVLVGKSILSNQTGAMALKISHNLNMVSTTHFIHTSHKYTSFHAVVEHDKSIYLTGDYSKDNDNFMVLAFALNSSNLAYLGAKYFGLSTSSEFGRDIKTNNDEKSLHIAGWMEKDKNEDGLLLSLSLDKELDFEWAKITMLKDNDDRFNALAIGEGETIYLTGDYNKIDTETDIFIVETDEKGEACCLEAIDLKKGEIPNKRKKECTDEKVDIKVYKYAEFKDKYKEYDLCKEESSLELRETKTPAVDMMLVPNPTTGLFNLSLLAEEDYIKDVSIVNSLGELIYQRNFDADAKQKMHTCDLRNIASGVYWVRLLTEKSQQITKRLVLTND